MLSKEELIDIWIDLLQGGSNVPDINADLAIRDLKKLRILYRACDLHNAGNISGEVYKNLWISLLAPLNNKIQLLKT